MGCEKQAGDHDHEYVEISLDDISLRSLELSDIDDFMAWASDDKISQYTLWYGYTSREDGLEFIEKIAIPHPYLRAICLRNRVIGFIKVTPDSAEEGCHKGQLGYVLASKYWGQGIATRAAMMVVSDVFEKWPHLERLEGLVHAQNRGSQRVLEKAGSTREGLLRKYTRLKGVTVDVVMFSLLSSD